MPASLFFCGIILQICVIIKANEKEGCLSWKV